MRLKINILNCSNLGHKSILSIIIYPKDHHNNIRKDLLYNHKIQYVIHKYIQKNLLKNKNEQKKMNYDDSIQMEFN